jgi:hypothetical protein
VRRGIVTPTYRPHFGYSRQYFESALANLEDTGFPHYLVVERADIAEISAMLPCEGRLNITVLDFDGLLAEHGIQESPSALLRRHGRFTYQTLKKFYALLHLKLDQALVLDAESLWVAPVRLETLFDRYFDDPFIVVSRLSSRREPSALVHRVHANAGAILGLGPTPYSTLESFHWFYDWPSFSALIAEHGAPISWADKLLASRGPGEQDIFEIVVYYCFLLANPARFPRRLVLAEEALAQHLGPTLAAAYLRAFNDGPLASAGLVEHLMLHLTADNVAPLTAFARQAGYTIARAEASHGILNLQRQFVSGAGIKLLAASQDHALGSSDRTAVNGTVSQGETLAQRTRRLPRSALAVGRGLVSRGRAAAAALRRLWQSEPR